MCECNPGRVAFLKYHTGLENFDRFPACLHELALKGAIRRKELPTSEVQFYPRLSSEI